MSTREVTNYISENSGLAREVAKSAFKAARNGNIPVALMAVGVTAITGVVVNEVVSDMIDDVGSEVVGEAMIDVVSDILDAI